ncbi:MAG: metalloregulator ArsR/SmtB family transcription factor [Verrucomicrobiota bacterium]
MNGINCIAVLKALSEPTRLRILRQLLKDRRSVNEVAEQLKVSQYNVSKHLRILREAGLLEVEKQGKLHLYTVAPRLRKHLENNANTLALDCCTFRFDKLPK